MALSDLITRQIATPLEGFDKAVESGFNIAKQQQELSIAQEKLQLEKQQIQDSFMTKGMNLMSVLPKLKNKKTKTFYMGLMKDYFLKSGFDQGRVDSLFSQLDADDELATKFGQQIETLNKLYPPNSLENINRQRQWLAANMDKDEEARLIQEEFLGGQQKAFFAQQTLGVTTGELAKRGMTSELTKAAAPGHVLERANQGDLDYANQWRMASEKLNQARTTLKDAKLVDPARRKEIEGLLNRSQAMMLQPDTFEQGLMLADQAQVMAGELVSEAAAQEEAGKTKRSEIIQKGTESRFQRGQQLRREEFEQRKEEKRLTDVTKSTDNIIKDSVKDYEQVLSSVTQLENVLNDPSKTLAEIKQNGAIFARSILGEKGALSDADINRIFIRTLGTDIKGIQSYFFGKATPPKTIVETMKRNVARFKAAKVELTLHKLVRGLEKNSLDARLGSEFQIGKSGWNIIVNQANDIIRSNGLNISGKSIDPTEVEKFIRQQKKRNEKESEEQYNKRIESIIRKSILNRMLETNETVRLM